MQTISTMAGYEQADFIAAVACAERRALHSYFDQHVIEDCEGGYIAIDQGDYAALPMAIIDRVGCSMRSDITGRGGDASPLFCSSFGPGREASRTPSGKPRPCPDEATQRHRRCEGKDA